MKKLFTLLILVGFVSILLGANVISVVSTSVNAGAEFDVEVTVDNDDWFNAFQFYVHYASGFSYNDEAVLSSRKDDHVLSDTDHPEGNPPYVILASYSNDNSNFNGTSGTIVTLTFQASSTPGDYTFSLSNSELSYGSGTPLAHTTSSGTITVT